jgi:SAM-dependent methyltransferase
MESTAPLGSFRIFENHHLAVDSALTLFAFAQALAADAHTIVDVGCGRGGAVDPADRGRPMHDMRGPGRRVIGIDVKDAGEHNPVIDEFRMIAGNHWPLDDGSVDLALCDWVLEHVEDPRSFVAELTRVLRPGGAFIARTVNRASLLSMAARTIPNRLHPRLVARLQPTRESCDVFPTAYRMNTVRDVAAVFDPCYKWAVSFHPGLDAYAGRWPALAAAITVLEPRMPRRMQSMLIVTARKR